MVNAFRMKDRIGSPPVNRWAKLSIKLLQLREWISVIKQGRLIFRYLDLGQNFNCPCSSILIWSPITIKSRPAAFTPVYTIEKFGAKRRPKLVNIFKWQSIGRKFNLPTEISAVAYSAREFFAVLGVFTRGVRNVWFSSVLDNLVSVGHLRKGWQCL